MLIRRLGMMSTLYTNVAYADDPSGTPNWQVWGGGGTTNPNQAWLTWQRLPTDPPSFNRKATYPFVIPQATGMTAAVSIFPRTSYQL
jgi:hypothetical protein